MKILRKVIKVIVYMRRIIDEITFEGFSLAEEFFRYLGKKMRTLCELLTCLKRMDFGCEWISKLPTPFPGQHFEQVRFLKQFAVDAFTYVILKTNGEKVFKRTE